MDQKTIKVLKELPEEMAYLKPLYEEIHAEKVVKIEKVIDNYMITFTDKAMKALVHSVKDSLKESGMMTQVQVGLINKKEEYAPEHIFSLSENTANKILKQTMMDLIKHNRSHLVRVYPKGTRIGSTNYEPHRYWSAGCQLVALNWQTFGESVSFSFFFRVH